MSRARPYTHNGETFWFDQKSRATAAQLELLSDIEGIDLDDLLDEGLGQRQVLLRLRSQEEHHLIPEYVLERRRERQARQGAQVACRICSLDGRRCEGSITRHHFVPRWLMLELESYQAYASRSVCTIPICVGRHRDLHLRDDRPKSIIPYLRPHERRFAHKLLDALKEEHRAIFDLIMSGDASSYEYQLMRDYTQGLLLKDEQAYELPEYQFGTAQALAVG
jgi:hypothetical protein